MLLDGSKYLVQHYLQLVRRYISSVAYMWIHSVFILANTSDRSPRDVVTLIVKKRYLLDLNIQCDQCYLQRARRCNSSVACTDIISAFVSEKSVGWVTLKFSILL